MGSDLRWGAFSGVFFVSWPGVPTRVEMGVITPELIKAAGPGERTIFLSIPGECRRPTAEENDASLEFVETTLRAHAVHAHMVVAAPGIIGSMVRSALSSVIMLKGYTDLVTIHDSTLHALNGISRRHHLPEARLILGARAQDLLPTDPYPLAATDRRH